jgi:hypothetical protein
MQISKAKDSGVVELPLHDRAFHPRACAARRRDCNHAFFFDIARYKKDAPGSRDLISSITA